MTYFEAFESIKKKLKDAKTESLKEDFAIQVNLTDDDCSGAFYIELKDGKLNVEPYDYVDRNALVSSLYADLVKAIDKKAVTEGVVVEGDAAVVEALLKSVKKTTKKPAAKKPAAKKTAAKTQAKKSGSKIAEVKAKVESKVEAKKSEKTEKKAASKKTK